MDRKVPRPPLAPLAILKEYVPRRMPWESQWDKDRRDALAELNKEFPIMKEEKYADVETEEG